MNMPFSDLRRITGLLLSKYGWMDVEQLGCLEVSLEPSTETGRANVRPAACNRQTDVDRI